MVNFTTVESRNKDRSRGGPKGHRFLIQLVDARTLEKAEQEVVDLFGDRIAVLAAIVPGTEQPTECVNGWLKNWKPNARGFTVYIPNDVTLDPIQ